MSKTVQVPVRVRVCNCKEVLVNGKPFHLPDGVMRALLEKLNPKWKLVPKEPEVCTHWQYGMATAPTHPKR